MGNLTPKFNKASIRKLDEFIKSFKEDYLSSKMKGWDICKQSYVYAKELGLPYKNVKSICNRVYPILDEFLHKKLMFDYKEAVKEGRIIKLDPLPKITFHNDDITIGMVKENPELWNDWHRQQNT